MILPRLLRRPPWRSPNRRGLVRYVLGWLGAGVLAVAVYVVLANPEAEPVTLPPIQETQMEVAAARAGCVLRRTARRLSPPGPAAPLRAGIYDEPADPVAVAEAVRRGVIVVRYRPSLSEDQLARLRALQEAVPAGTILLPSRIEMRFAVTAVTSGRWMGCMRTDNPSLDALRLFRGRYLGVGQ